MNSTLAVFLLVVLATSRLSHLVVDDNITEPIRNRISALAWKGLSWDGATGKHTGQTLSNHVFGFLDKIVSCVNCTSVWAAALTTSLAVQYADLDLSLIAYAGWVLSASLLTGLIADWRYNKQSI